MKNSSPSVSVILALLALPLAAIPACGGKAGGPGTGGGSGSGSMSGGQGGSISGGGGGVSGGGVSTIGSGSTGSGGTGGVSSGGTTGTGGGGFPGCQPGGSCTSNEGCGGGSSGGGGAPSCNYSCTCVNGSFQCSGTVCPPPDPPCPTYEPNGGDYCQQVAQQCAYVQENTSCGADICTCDASGWACQPSCITYTDAGFSDSGAFLDAGSFGD